MPAVTSDSLSNSEGEGCAFAAAAAADLSGISTWSLHLHAVGAGPGNHGRGDRHRELRAAVDCGRDDVAIEQNNRGSNEVAARQNHLKGVRHLRKRNGRRGNCRESGFGPRASADKIDWVTSREKQQYEQE